MNRARMLQRLATVKPIDLAEAKLHCRVSSSDEDALIDALIDVAWLTAESRTALTFLSADWRLTCDGFSSTIELPNPPVFFVNEIRYKNTDGTTTILPTSEYYVDYVSYPARVIPAVGASFPATQSGAINSVEIDYTAGYGMDAENIPRTLKQWMLLAIVDMYENRGAISEKPKIEDDFARILLDQHKVYAI